MAKTKIEWADEVWNPVWGCYENCPYCYARKFARRFGKTDRQKNFMIEWMPRNFERKFSASTKRVFVNSMSDIYHWPIDYMNKIVAKIRLYPDIQFIFLTKNHQFSSKAYWHYNYPSNCILGYTDDCRLYKPVFTNPELRSNWSFVREHLYLLNLEPLLGPARHNPIFYDWIILGAETGNQKNKTIPQWEWISCLVKTAMIAGIPVFMKPSLRPYVPEGMFLQQFPEVVK